MSENEFTMSAAQEHRLLYEQGYALTGSVDEAAVYHDAVILGFVFTITPGEEGGAFVDLSPQTELMDARSAQAGQIWSRQVAGGDDEAKRSDEEVPAPESPSPTETTIVDLLQEKEREGNRQSQQRFRQGLKDKPEEVQERYRGYKKTYRQKPEVRAAEAERQRRLYQRRKAQQEPQDPAK